MTIEIRNPNPYGAVTIFDYYYTVEVIPENLGHELYKILNHPSAEEIFVKVR